MRRTLNVARLQLVPWQATRALPWAVLALSFGINLLIQALLGPEDRGNTQTGGLASIYVFSLIAYVRAMVQVFPFAVGLGVTRRRFYTATAMFTVVEAVVYGTILYLLRLVEDATGGWGVALRFFGVSYLVQDNALLQILIYAVPFLLVAFVGVFVGAMFKRWGVYGMYALSIGSLVVAGALSVLVTWQHQWSALGNWFLDRSALTLVAGLPALAAVVLAAGGFLLIRRANP